MFSPQEKKQYQQIYKNLNLPKVSKIEQENKKDRYYHSIQKLPQPQKRQNSNHSQQQSSIFFPNVVKSNNIFLQKLKTESLQPSSQIIMQIYKHQKKSQYENQKTSNNIYNSAILSSQINKIILHRLQSIPQILTSKVQAQQNEKKNQQSLDSSPYLMKQLQLNEQDIDNNSHFNSISSKSQVEKINFFKDKNENKIDKFQFQLKKTQSQVEQVRSTLLNLDANIPNMQNIKLNNVDISLANSSEEDESPNYKQILQRKSGKNLTVFTQKNLSNNQSPLDLPSLPSIRSKALSQNFIHKNKMRVSRLIPSFEVIEHHNSQFSDSPQLISDQINEQDNEKEKEKLKEEIMINQIFTQVTQKRLIEKMKEQKLEKLKRISGVRKSNKKSSVIYVPNQEKKIEIIAQSNQLLDFSTHLKEFINDFADICKSNLKFNELLNHYSSMNYDQFIFYFQKFLFYICLLDEKQLQGLEFFKLNFGIMNIISFIFEESINKNSHLSQKQKEIFISRFQSNKSKLQPNSITEYFGSQQNINKLVDSLLNNLKKTHFEKIILAQEDYLQLRQKIVQIFNYFLWGDSAQVIVNVRNYSKFTYDNITYNDFLSLKLCLQDSINQTLKLPAIITEEVIEKYEQYRNFIILNSFIGKTLTDTNLKLKIIDKLKFSYASKILQLGSLTHLTDQLIDYIFSNISSRQFIETLKNSTQRDRLIENELILDMKTQTSDTLALDRVIPKIISFLIDYKFFKLQILLKLIPNYGEYLRTSDLQQQMEAYFKVSFQSKPLKLGYSMNDVYKFSGLFIIIDYYYCDRDIFSPFDLQLLIEKFTCKKKYIFKLWFKAIKHCIKKKYHVDQKQAKIIRNQLKDIIFDNYQFEIQ